MPHICSTTGQGTGSPPAATVTDQEVVHDDSSQPNTGGPLKEPAPLGNILAFNISFSILWGDKSLI